MLHELTLHVVSERFHSLIKLAILVVLLQRAFSVHSSIDFLLDLLNLLCFFLGSSVNHCGSRCCLAGCSLSTGHSCIFLLRLRRLRLLGALLETLHVHLLKDAQRRLTLAHHVTHLGPFRMLPLLFIHFFVRIILTFLSAGVCGGCCRGTTRLR